MAYHLIWNIGFQGAKETNKLARLHCVDDLEWLTKNYKAMIPTSRWPKMPASWRWAMCAEAVRIATEASKAGKALHNLTIPSAFRDAYLSSWINSYYSSRCWSGSPKTFC